MTHTAADDPMLDDEWLAAPRTRPRARVLLLVVLGAACCFLAGAQIQKHFGAADGATTAGVGGLPQGIPTGLPQGLTGGSLPGSPSSGSTSGGSSASTASVIGTVVAIHGHTWVVKDLGGTTHRVAVSGRAAVTRETTVSAGDVAVGARVDITGTGSGARIRADQVTLRKP
jgi:hypothetical protein